MQALEACAGHLASGVPAHLMQRTRGCDLAAASPASCVRGLGGCNVGTACNSGACFLTRTQLRALVAVRLKCREPDGKEGPLCSAPGGQAPSRGSPRACLKVDGSAD